MSITADQLYKELAGKEYRYENSEFNWDYELWGIDRKTDIGHVKLETQIGGCEGDGEYLAYILAVTQDDGKIQYFRIQGRYNSWDSNDWWGSEFEEVEPTPVSTIRWDAK